MATPMDRIVAIRDLVGTFTQAGFIAPLRPDKYLRIAAAVRSDGPTITVGIAMGAQRCPERAAMVDEIGTLTYRQLDERCNALGAALHALPDGPPASIGVMCRNHRGFVEAVTAANKIGADILLLNTSFAGPALAEVVDREDIDLVIYDEDFAPAVERALGDSQCARLLGWTESEPADDGPVTLEDLITAQLGQRPAKATRQGKMVMLTSGTTGTPKGARRPSAGGGGIGDLKAILDRVPLRAEETTVIVAPMFHAWGFSQLMLTLMMACTVVTRRKFDPAATLELVEDHDATGLVVVPVMLDRIMNVPADVLDSHSGRTLRFATASGSRMRPDVVTAFMDRFGDVVYNNYNATEAGMIATAVPTDLRRAPDTAGKAAVGTELRILDDLHHDVPDGEIGQIFVHNSTQFDGYTGGANKMFHEGFMASGDVGYIDDSGLLFVVGRDDEMIVSGGENVYPIEVEKMLVAHDDVAEASVIGVDDETYGQRLAAFVVLRDGASGSVDALKQHVRDSLANYKVPRDITLLDELPRNSTGKVLRRELQERAGNQSGA